MAIRIHKREAYLIGCDKVLKLLPLTKIGDEYAIKVKKNEPNFIFFENFFIDTSGSTYIDVELFEPFDYSIDEIAENLSLIDLCSACYMKLQFKNNKDYNDWVLFEFYIHEFRANPNSNREVFSKLKRTISLNSLLS